MTTSGLRSIASASNWLNSPKFQKIFQHVRDANDRMLCQVEGQFHAGGGHLRAARAEENGRRWRTENGGLLAQRGHQFRREQIPARLPGDEHEVFWFHSKFS